MMTSIEDNLRIVGQHLGIVIIQLEEYDTVPGNPRNEVKRPRELVRVAVVHVSEARIR